MHSLRQRINTRDESGFTLIELLVVLIIIGVLLAIAVPSYLGFKDRAQKAAAASNVRAAIPDAEAYYSDNQSYASMNLAALQAIDKGVSGTLTVFGSATGYCLSNTQGSHIAKVVGPGGTVDDSAAAACTSATG
jgi:type IV pilus assembly protein PilA